MKLNIIIYCILSVFTFSLVAIPEPSTIQDEIFFAGVPKDVSVPGTIEILDNDSFVVGFSEERGTPAWVAYRVDQVNHFENLKRPSRFKTDSRVSSPVKHSDYTHSGYDRGHMAPHFAIATRHPEDMKDTYLMTNIIPQSPNLNRGAWLDLEMNVAKRYAQYRDEVWVICGPIYDDDEETERLKDKVSVPTACFKIVVDVTPEGHINLMSFVFPQDIARNAELKDFLVSIDEVEERTGIDFLHMLKDEHEEKLEKWQPKRIWR